MAHRNPPRRTFVTGATMLLLVLTAALAQGEPPAEQDAQPAPQARPRPRFEREGNEEGHPSGGSGSPLRPFGQKRMLERLEAADAPGIEHEDEKHIELTPEMMRKALEVLRDFQPQLADFAEKNPDRAQKMIQRFPRIAKLVQMREQDPEKYAAQLQLAKSERERLRLALQVREARQQGRTQDADRAKEQLGKLIREQFDARLKQREQELQQMESRLSELRSQLTRMRENADRWVDEELRKSLERKPLAPPAAGPPEKPEVQ